ncbi:hypothetical protein FHS18_004237 [Paenibacillus phyllosphaerae]|uniref:Uncharacterized protein n=1 Tax=Paenibacillus phyllosphaerae TaxID=274593 RepID=A0A7W5B0H2_9BACL|nr:hypothetical protein [Paenibacillus phyllosphaerae]MBB3112159.1 hypothetical protein [Paenibacillus phyllosphaerae]
MRSILVSLLLIIVVITMYASITGGETGMHEQLEQSGNKMSDTIERLSP